MSNFYGAISLIGGVSGSLDNIDGALLADGDGAIVISGIATYMYTLDVDSGLTESEPDVISPDANAGVKRWILVAHVAPKIKYTAASVAIRNSHGTSPDGVADLQVANDGLEYVLREEAETPGLDMEVVFTGVLSFHDVQILCRYLGSAGHSISVELEVSPFDGSTWHHFDEISDLTSDQNYENHSFFVRDESVYINAGVVKVRLNHAMAGVANHYLYIDEVALYR